jgi:hypothetical protein
LGLLPVFVSDDAGGMELALAFQCLFRQLLVGLSLACVGLGLAKIGGTECRQNLADVDLAADFHVDFLNASTNLRHDTNRVILVPHQPSRQAQR